MNITDLIQGAVASRTTRFAFELLPPLKGDGTRSVFGAIDPLMDFNPAYINVTFHREALKEDIRPDGSREWHIIAAVRARSASRPRSGASTTWRWFPT